MYQFIHMIKIILKLELATIVLIETMLLRFRPFKISKVIIASLVKFLGNSAEKVDFAYCRLVKS